MVEKVLVFPEGEQDSDHVEEESGAAWLHSRINDLSEAGQEVGLSWLCPSLCVESWQVS